MAKALWEAKSALRQVHMRVAVLEKRQALILEQLDVAGIEATEETIVARVAALARNLSDGRPSNRSELMSVILPAMPVIPEGFGHRQTLEEFVNAMDLEAVGRAVIEYREPRPIKFRGAPLEGAHTDSLRAQDLVASRLPVGWCLLWRDGPSRSSPKTAYLWAGDELPPGFEPWGTGTR